MEKKYEITPNKRVEIIDGTSITTRQIRACRNFGHVKKGDIGGYIDSEENLSHEGDCWIHDNAMALQNARVMGGAQVFDNAMICGDAMVGGNAQINEYARISDHALVTKHADISGHAEVKGYTKVSGFATVSGMACVTSQSRIKDHAFICGSAHIDGNALITGDSYIEDAIVRDACIKGNARIDNSRITNDVVISGDAIICHGDIRSNRHFLVIGPLDSRIYTFYTACPEETPTILVASDTEMYYGLDNFKKEIKAKKIPKEKKRMYQDVFRCVESWITRYKKYK